MRRTVFALCLAAALLPVAAPAHARAAGCGPRAARTVAHTRIVRVFVVRPAEGVRRYLACLRSGSRPVRVAEVETFSNESGEYRGALRRLLLRGRYVTAQTTDCTSRGPCDYSVAVTDVARRRLVASSDPYTSGRVVKLVASDRGEAAFLAYDAVRGKLVLDKMDDYGVSERDSGDLGGLRLVGRRIGWVSAGARRSEPIAHVRRCGPGPPAYSAEIGRSARVYGVDPDEDPDATEWFACLHSGGRPLSLGADVPGNSGYGYHDDFQIDNGFVGWFEVGCTGHDCGATLHVADLRGRTIRSGRYHGTGTLLLNERGFAAEITRRANTGTEISDLYAFDSAGERLIDTDIDPASVAIETGAITWLHGGEPRREELR